MYVVSNKKIKIFMAKNFTKYMCIKITDVNVSKLCIKITVYISNLIMS